MLIGAGEVGQEACRALAEGIDKRRQEVTDVVCTGSTPGDDPTQAARFTEPRLAFGMTWWLECIAPFNFGAGFEEPWPLETMRARILAGPPRMQNLPEN